MQAVSFSAQRQQDEHTMSMSVHAVNREREERVRLCQASGAAGRRGTTASAVELQLLEPLGLCPLWPSSAHLPVNGVVSNEH